MIEIDDDRRTEARGVRAGAARAALSRATSSTRLIDDDQRDRLRPDLRACTRRLDETIAHVTARVQAGNLYVNRNIIGAVVGVQPFGGRGLSGTGPKAGGPLYLHRLLAHGPRPALAAPGGPMQLPARPASATPRRSGPRAPSCALPIDPAQAAGAGRRHPRHRQSAPPWTRPTAASALRCSTASAWPTCWRLAVRDGPIVPVFVENPIRWSS